MRYDMTRAPIPPSGQKLNVLRLLAKMGRSFLNHGFDFSLGILGYEKREKKGPVDYFEYIKKQCGAACRSAGKAKRPTPL